MSEYQYYEFLALDRPLTDAEYREVRALSTRAQITRTRFVNEYQWGDFRGDPSALMDRYYDAHLYFANWGTRILMLRLPLALLDPKTAKPYCDGEYTHARRSGKNIVIEWRSEDEEGDEDWAEGGPGPLAALVGLRAELAAGDLRPLYLGWLASLSGGDEDGADEPDEELDDEHTELEPPPPPGLDRLTAAQSALVDFLRVDRDLLTAATAPACGGNTDPSGSDAALDAWIKQLSPGQKDAALRRLLSGDDPHAKAELLRAARPKTAVNEAALRPVRGLRAQAATLAETRQAARRAELAAQQAQREQALRQAREERIAALAGQGDRPWAEVNALLAEQKAKSYDAALQLLVDLQEVLRRNGQDAAFARRLAELRLAHPRKPAFIRRLDTAKLP